MCGRWSRWPMTISVAGLRRRAEPAEARRSESARVAARHSFCGKGSSAHSTAVRAIPAAGIRRRRKGLATHRQFRPHRLREELRRPQPGRRAIIPVSAAARGISCGRALAGSAAAIPPVTPYRRMRTGGRRQASEGEKDETDIYL